MFGLRRHNREDPVRAVQDALSATVTMSLMPRTTDSMKFNSCCVATFPDRDTSVS